MPLPAGGWAKDAAQRALVARRLRRSCESLLAQGIERWELVIGVAAPQKPLVNRWFSQWFRQWSLQSVTQSATQPTIQWGNKQQHRFKVVTCPIAQSINGLKPQKLVAAAEGDWVSFAFAGDRFAPHFVYECLMRIVQRPAVQMVYFDDDLLKVRARVGVGRRGKLEQPADLSESYARTKPQFKPDFSPDFLLNHNYIGLSFVVKHEHLIKLINAKWQQSLNFPMQLVLGLSQSILPQSLTRASTTGVSSAQLKTPPAWHEQHPIQHIGQVLRHRNTAQALGTGLTLNQAWWHELSRAAVNDGRGQAESLFGAGDASGADKLLTTVPKVSIIVPTKDQCAILKVCLESLLEKTHYPNFEVVVVDNQTTQVSALRYLRALPSRDSRVTVMRYDQPFNYSDINNQAVVRCDGDILLFLNNDVEVLDGNWLREMVCHASRPDVGCVGAKLLYPDYTIQHAGVALGMHGVADHMYRGMQDCRESDPYGYLNCVRNPAAVTGAVMAVERSVFDAVGGFDAIKLPVAFNDVDLCLKAEMAGFRTVWTPGACLIHHESKTRAPRKLSGSGEKQAMSGTTSKFSASNEICVQSHSTERSEILYMRKSWGKLLKSKYEVLGQRHETLRFL
jgi:GT2 family glycosyltransferase